MFEGFDLFLERGERIVEIFDLGLIGNFERGGGEGGDSRCGAAFAHGAGALEDPGESVVVGGWDGIELVVVTAGAAEGHAEEGAPDGIDLLVNEFHFQELVVLQFVVEGTEDEVSRADELRVSLGG